VSAPTIDHLLPYDGTLLRRTADYETGDEYGNPTWDEVGEPVKCWLEPMGSREELGTDPAVQIRSYRLFLPPETPPRGWDAITVDGVTYELDGDSFMRASLIAGNAAHHVEAYVRVTV